MVWGKVKDFNAAMKIMMKPLLKSEIILELWDTDFKTHY
jgi:hypothetical protein